MPEQPPHPPSTPARLVTAEDVLTTDPPPPYPSRERRSARTRRHGRVLHTQIQDAEHVDPHIQRRSSPSRPSFPVSEAEVGEDTPLLAPPSPRSLRCHVRRSAGRPRSLSHTSLVSYASVAPSLAQTVISLFQPEGDDEDTDLDYDLPSDTDRSGFGHTAWPDGEDNCDQSAQHRHCALLSRRVWRRYFTPVTKKVYYMALLHLLVLNFPYALAAWVYLFVFTLVSTRFLLLSFQLGWAVDGPAVYYCPGLSLPGHILEET